MAASSDSPRPRVRLTSIAVALAAFVVAACFFLPWVRIPGEEAEHFQEEMTRRLGDPAEPLPPGVEAADWQRLSALAAEQGEVSGIDVFYWARTARATSLAYEGPSPVSRAMHLLAIVLAGVHGVALAVALALLVGRLHHAPSPVLVLALLTGAFAIAIPAAYSIVTPALGFPTRPSLGLYLLLPAGGLLLLAGVFGVRRRNWWRVLFGTLVTGGLIVLLAWSYVANAA